MRLNVDPSWWRLGVYAMHRQCMCSTCSSRAAVAQCYNSITMCVCLRVPVDDMQASELLLSSWMLAEVASLLMQYTQIFSTTLAGVCLHLGSAARMMVGREGLCWCVWDAGCWRVQKAYV